MKLEDGKRWTVITGDNREILPTLERVDHVITDPPYSEHTHSKQWISASLTARGSKRISTGHKELGFASIEPAHASKIAAHAKDICSRWILVFTDIEGVALWRDAMLASGLDYVRTCIWDKVDGAPQFTGDRPAAGAEAFVCSHPKGKKRWNGGGRRNVFRHAVNGERGTKPHPSTKPLPLMLELVELFTDPGDLVLDPFCGSGTTGVACLRLGRRFIGIEQNPEWAELSRQRLEAEEKLSTLSARRSGQEALFR